MYDTLSGTRKPLDVEQFRGFAVTLLGECVRSMLIHVRAFCRGSKQSPLAWLHPSGGFSFGGAKRTIHN